MKQTRIRVLITTLLFFALSQGVRADEPFGLLRSLSGGGLSLFRDGTRVFYTPDDLADGPIVVEPNDLVQTEAGAFADVQILPGTDRIRIAEFSTVGFTEEFVADLVYGRVLVAAESPVRVESHGTRATGGQTATFGVDFVAERAVGAIPVSLVYVTEGTATVAGESAEPIALEDGDMVRAARVRGEDGTVSLVVETDAIDLDIVEFWEENGFGAISLSAPEVVERYPSLEPRIADWLEGARPSIAEAPVEERLPEPAPIEPEQPREVEPTADEVLDQAIPRALRPEIRTVDYTGARRFLRGTALTTMTLGLIAEGVGLVLLFAPEAVVPDLDADLVNTIAVGLTIGGGASVGTGLISYIVSNVLGSGSQ